MIDAAPHRPAPSAALLLDGPPDFVRATKAALALLHAGDPRRAALVAASLRRISGLDRRGLRRVGRATLYGRDRQALTRPVDYAWVDRREGRCYVAPSVWQAAAADPAALRRYAGILVHEAAHLYLDTHDEAACNAEMRAAESLLTPAP